MKNKPLATLVAIGLAAASMGSIPTTASASVTVGVGDTGNCYPFLCNDSGVSTGQSIDYQQIYSSAAFSGPISFNNITFYPWTGGSSPVLSGNYTITFSTTTASLGAGYPVGPLSNIQTFFSGALGGETGDVSISGASYSYNPADGNLVMEVVATDQANVPNYSGNGYMEADDSGLVESRAFAFAGSSSGYSDAVGLVTTFATGVPEPTTWVIMLTGLGLAGGALRRKTAARRLAA